MKNSGFSFLGLAFACAVILCFIDAVASSKAAAPAQAPEPQPPYEVALIDKSMTGGWTSPSIARVDVRGETGGPELKRTFEVDHGNWKAALTRAKAYADSIRGG